jgi:hypothetical protein
MAAFKPFVGRSVQRSLSSWLLPFNAAAAAASGSDGTIGTVGSRVKSKVKFRSFDSTRTNSRRPWAFLSSARTVGIADPATANQLSPD